jgi:hypothetical protein
MRLPITSTIAAVAVTLILPVAALPAVEVQGIRAERWNGLLMVTAPAALDIEGALADRFPARVTVDARDEELPALLERLAGLGGVNLVVAPELRADPTPITLKAEAMPLGQALRWVARLGGIRIGWSDGALFASRQPVGGSMTTRFYDVRDLELPIRDFPGPDLAIPEPGGRGTHILPPPQDAKPAPADVVSLLAEMIASGQVK